MINTDLSQLITALLPQPNIVNFNNTKFVLNSKWLNKWMESLIH